MLAIQKKLIFFNHSAGNDIKNIVIHDTGNSGSGANALSHYNYFNGGDRQSSAHYFIDDKNIIQLVEDSEASWHCGDGGNAYGIGNHNSIGIEICINPESNYFTAVYNTIELVALLMKKYNIPIDNVVRHYDASRKNCPGSMNKDGSWSGWTVFKNQLRDYIKLSSIKPIKTVVFPGYLIKINSNKYDANVVKVQSKLGITSDGYFGSGTKQAVINFQSKSGLTADGVVGQITWNKLFN